MESLPPSEQAMESLLGQTDELKRPSIYVPDPKVPDLPQLGRMAREMQQSGRDIINASAGDLGEVGIDLSLEFYEHLRKIQEETRDKSGQLLFRRQLKYVPEVPRVLEVMKETAGVKMQTNGLHTPSGRLALYAAFQGMKAHHAELHDNGRPTLIAGPVVWSGYKPLGEELGFDIVNTPVTPGHGLQMTAGAIEETLQFLKSEKRSPLGIVAILPDNPSGQSIDSDELVKILVLGAENKVPALVDGLYSPLAPEGQKNVLNMAKIEELPPEVLQYFSLLLGTTKCVSSRDRLAALYYPKQGEISGKTFNRAQKSHRALSAYNGMHSVELAYAISTFPKGIHAAMGDLYGSIEDSRQKLKAIFDRHRTPAVIGKSFYGMSFLADGESGEPLVRDDSGQPFKDSSSLAAHLANKYGYFMAPGRLFRSGEALVNATRNSAALSPDAIDRIGFMMDDIYERRRASF